MIRFDFHDGHKYASATYRVVGFTPTPGRAHRFGPRELSGPDGVPVAVLIDGVRYPVEPVPFSPTLLRRDYTRPGGGYSRKLAGGELEVRVPERWDRVFLDLFSLAPGEVDVLIDVLIEARRVIASRPTRTPRPLGRGPIHRAVWNETDGRPTASAYVAWIVREELNPWGVWPNIIPRHLSQGDTRWFGPPPELETRAAIEARDVLDFYERGLIPRHATGAAGCSCGWATFTTSPDGDHLRDAVVDHSLVCPDA